MVARWCHVMLELGLGVVGRGWGWLVVIIDTEDWGTAGLLAMRVNEDLGLNRGVQKREYKEQHY